MVCCLFDALPLPEPTLTYCQLDPWEQTSVKFEPKYKPFHSWKCIWKRHLQNGGHFVQGEMGQSYHKCKALSCNTAQHWNENVVILMKSSSLAAPKVVKMTTFSAASDEDFIKMTTFSFQWNRKQKWCYFPSACHLTIYHITQALEDRCQHIDMEFILSSSIRQWWFATRCDLVYRLNNTTGHIRHISHRLGWQWTV